MSYETPISRDHARKRWLDDHPGLDGLNEQYQCQMCGAWFFMRATLARHREAEIPLFVAEADAMQADYEAARRRHRVVYPPKPREQCEVSR